MKRRHLMELVPPGTRIKACVRNGVRYLVFGWFADAHMKNEFHCLAFRHVGRGLWEQDRMIPIFPVGKSGLEVVRS